MRRPLLGAIAVVVGACGTTDPNHLADELMPGTVSFDFTGAGATMPTTFNATGIVSSSSPVWGTSPVAVAEVNSVRQAAAILGGVPTSETKWNQILLNVNRLTAGTAPINTSCFGVGSTCKLPNVQIEFDAIHQISIEAPTYICTILNGTITVTSISDRRISGTFSGTGLCMNSANASTPFTVTNGSFDVGVLISGKSLPRG